MKRINTPFYVDDATPKALLTQQQLHLPYQKIIDKYREATGFQMLSSAQLAKKLCIGISTGWLRTQQKLIPPPIKLSARSVRWVEREIDALLEAQVLASRTGLRLNIRLFVDVLTRPRVIAYDEELKLESESTKKPSL